MLDLLENVSDHFRSLFRVKLFGHSPKRDPYNVTMVQLRSRILVGQFKPHLVQEIEILRP
jgi:hypothetical protein